MTSIKLEHVEVLGEEPKFEVETEEVKETLLHIEALLKRKEEKRVMLIHGPYGSGKTYILNVANKYLEKNFKSNTEVFLVNFGITDNLDIRNLQANIIGVARNKLIEQLGPQGIHLTSDPRYRNIDHIIEYYAKIKPEIENFVFLIDELDKIIAGLDLKNDEDALNSISVFCTDRTRKKTEIDEREIQVIFVMGFSTRAIEMFDLNQYASEAIRRLGKYKRIRLRPNFGIKRYYEFLSKQLENQEIQGENEVNGFNIFPFPEIVVNTFFNQKKGNIGATTAMLNTFYKGIPLEIKEDPDVVKKLESYFNENWRSITKLRTGTLERYLGKDRETPEIKVAESTIKKVMSNPQRKIKKSEYEEMKQELGLEYDILHDTIMSDFFQEDTSVGDGEIIYEFDEKLAEFFEPERKLQIKEGSKDVLSIIKLYENLIRGDESGYLLKEFAGKVFPDMCSRYKETFLIEKQDEGGAEICFFDYLVKGQKFSSSLILRMLLLPNERPSEKEIEEIRSLTKDDNKIYVFCTPINPNKYKKIFSEPFLQKKSSINPYIPLSQCFFYMINAKKVEGIEGFQKYKRTLLACAAESNTFADRAEIDREAFYVELSEFMHRGEVLKLYSLFDSADFISDLTFYLQIERLLKLSCPLHWKLRLEFDRNEREFVREIEEIAARKEDLRIVEGGQLLWELGIIRKDNGNFMFMTKNREDYSISPFENILIDILTRNFRGDTISFSDLRKALLSRHPGLANLAPRIRKSIVEGYLRILEQREEIALETLNGQINSIVFKPKERLQSQRNILFKLGYPEIAEGIIKDEKMDLSKKIAKLEKEIKQVQERKEGRQVCVYHG